MKISVVQWNTAGTKALAALALEASSEYDFLAIQEPWTNRDTGQVYCPSNSRYEAVYSCGRAALYIHKRHSQAILARRTGVDWSMASLQTIQGALEIWSIYSPKYEARNWLTPLRELAAQEPGRSVVAVGDFNLHHPLWDRHNRESRGADKLLTLGARWGLTRLTPWGETTRFKHNNRSSTIDLAWASTQLPAQYMGGLDLAGSDHIAQHTQIDYAALPPRGRGGWTWAKMDITLAEAEARTITYLPASTPEDLDRSADALVEQLLQIAKLSTPQRKPAQGQGAHWWNQEVEEAVRRSKHALRAYRAAPSQWTWEDLQESIAEQKTAVARAQQQSWRRALAEATERPEQLWKLERWAKTASVGETQSRELPPLVGPDGIERRTHAGKATLLGSRFFPAPCANAEDLYTYPAERSIHLEQGITVDEVEQIIRSSGAWKAPGEDQLPFGFLKVCGRPLADALAQLARDSYRLAYYPQRFRRADVVVIPKPGKTTEQRRTAAGWRPISLLNTLGKVLEAILATRIAHAAEEQRLLPEGQMGNRANRSTETALRAVTDAVYTAWGSSAIASLLQLDIKGAFDTVCHDRLVQVVRIAGFPQWVVRWVESFLTDRTARLIFDGAPAALRPISAGVPQGSPLSPILFQLYIATLYRALTAAPGVWVVGFADDTNLMAFGRSANDTVERLTRAWEHCDSWAERWGMAFAPEKSELIHFTRARAAATQSIRLGVTTLPPTESARFLGIWLDRKLRWRRHLTELRTRAARATPALTRLASSAWGCGFQGARQIYTMAIRSAMAYGASSWHTPAGGTTPRGIARGVGAAQNRCLRAVSGAYKATPTRCLETETGCPPFDLYCSERTARFEQRTISSGMAASLEALTKGIQTHLNEQGLRARTATNAAPSLRKSSERRQAWAQQWAEGNPRAALLRDWEARRQQLQRAAYERRGRRFFEPAEDTEASLRGWKRHKGLRKYESSVLTQARTGAIGLRAFLFRRGVPEVATPLCRCGEAPETAFHVVAECEQLESARGPLRDALAPRALRTRRDLASLLEDRRTARIVARWLVSSGRLPEFTLARRIEGRSSG